MASQHDEDSWLGCEAFWAGVSPCYCPFDEESDREADWLSGYMDAEIEWLMWGYRRLQ